MAVLVTYATAAGSTAGVAQRIADRLISDGFDVSCLPVDEVRDPIASYDAIVIGSAIHGQAWLPEAVRFIEKHAAELAGRPTWLFSVGMPAALGKALRRWAMMEGPKVLAQFADVRPWDSRLFSGVVLPSQLPVMSRVVFRLMGGRYGDFRDWDAIDRWADEINVAIPRVVTH
jgi:menaquinone-dependent protoporphyrinogen oxidase